MSNNTPEFFTFSTEPSGPLPKEFRKIKASFIEKSNKLTDSRVKDLEENLKINKEIVTELLDSHKSHDKSNVLQKLNSENKLLHFNSVF